MSLWHKPVELVTFDDIEAFCQQGQRRVRARLQGRDPDKLHKVVAAFANRLGGLIVLGIEADKVTNKPAWPPKGMKKTPGIEERITAMCRDNIYPPVPPQISPIIDNPHDAGTAVAVVRVDESPEAPHAVDGYIYERTGSQGDRFDFAKIDRISYLLERRGHIEEQRRELVDMDLKRAAHQLAEVRLRLGEKAGLQRSLAEEPGPRGLPLRWASVIPVYPWRDLCVPRLCYDSLSLFNSEISPDSWQKVPGGAFARRRNSPGSAPSPPWPAVAAEPKGHVFAMECTMETLSRRHAAQSGGTRPPSPRSVLISRRSLPCSYSRLPRNSTIAGCRSARVYHPVHRALRRSGRQWSSTSAYSTRESATDSSMRNSGLK